jgi:hypothetical protein
VHGHHLHVATSSTVASAATVVCGGDDDNNGATVTSALTAAAPISEAHVLQVEQLLDSPRSATVHRPQNYAIWTAALEKTQQRQGTEQMFARGLLVVFTRERFQNMFTQSELHLEIFAPEVDTGKQVCSIVKKFT